MAFQEYIILIGDFNNYTVFMHNTFFVPYLQASGL